MLSRQCTTKEEMSTINCTKYFSENFTLVFLILQKMAAFIVGTKWCGDDMPGSCEREMLVLRAHGESTASSLCFWPNPTPYSAANMYPQQGTLDKSFISLGFLLDFCRCCCYFYIKPKSLGNRLKKKEKTITHNLSNVMILVYFLMCSYLFFFPFKNILEIKAISNFTSWMFFWQCFVFLNKDIWGLPWWPSG